MKLKFLLGENGRGHKLTTLSGEILAEFGVDPEFIENTIYANAGSQCEPMRAKIVLDLVVGDGTTIIDGSVVPSNALPEAPRALSAPSQSVEYDYDPDDFGAFFCEEDEEDAMEGLCLDCEEPLCVHCGQCETPGCEAQECNCP